MWDTFISRPSLILTPKSDLPSCMTERMRLLLPICLTIGLFLFFEQHDLKLMRMLTDRGTEYCGNRENHEYELYLAVEDIDHSKIKAKSPQTNGICERFNRTVQNEFYAIAFRKKIYTSIEQLQADLDMWMNSYNTQRTHSGKYCFGKTPMQTFIEGIAVARKYQLQNQEMIKPNEQDKISIRL